MNNKLKQQMLKELKELLKTNFPNNIQTIFLFGSQALNTNRDYSDYDILILLKNSYNWQLKNKIYQLCYEIDLRYDILIDVKIISQFELNTLRGKQPFIQQAFEHGIII